MHAGCVKSPADNAVPGSALLLERAPSMFGQSFEVYHARPGTAQIDRAPVGAWWRTWGPWFWTYTYEDVGHSQNTLFMRPTIMGMMGLYSETRIMRCDGEQDVWYFGEGSNWISNRLRTFFGMQREASFKIYQGSSRVGTALETFHGTKSITFKTYPGDDEQGSAVLVANSGHTHDLWSIHTTESADIAHLPPFYVMNAAAVLMGFRWINIRHSRGIHANAPAPTPPAYFLAETSNASVAYIEEAEEAEDATDVDQRPELLEDGAESEAKEIGDEKTNA